MKLTQDYIKQIIEEILDEDNPGEKRKALPKRIAEQ